MKTLPMLNTLLSPHAIVATVPKTTPGGSRAGNRMAGVAYEACGWQGLHMTHVTSGPHTSARKTHLSLKISVPYVCSFSSN